MIGLALQVVVGYVTDAVLSLLPEAAADYSELVEETGMGDTSYLAVLTTVLGAPFCEELLVRGIIFEFSLRAFNPQCRPLWKRRRRANVQESAMVPWAAPSTWGIAAAIVLQAAVFGFMHMNWVQGCYAGAAGIVFGWVLVTTGKPASSSLRLCARCAKRASRTQRARRCPSCGGRLRWRPGGPGLRDYAPRCSARGTYRRIPCCP